MSEKQQFEAELEQLATKYSILRLKVETLNYKREYQLDDGVHFYLKTEKAVIKALGKTTVVPIGEGEEYSTYDEAREAVRNHWSAYFKARREARSDKAKLEEARRQKRYRERRKQRLEQFKRQV